MKIPNNQAITCAPFCLILYFEIVWVKVSIAPDFWKNASIMPMKTSIPSTQIKSAFPNALCIKELNPNNKFSPITSTPTKTPIKSEIVASLIIKANDNATNAGANDKIPYSINILLLIFIFSRTISPGL